MSNFKEVVEIIDLEFMKSVLEWSKLQTTQVVIIPRFVCGQPIYGINEGTIVVESRYQIFDEQLHTGKALWQSPSLPYIAFYSKDIAPFLRAISNIDKLFIVYHTYIVNGMELSIATKLFSDTQVTIYIGTEKVTTYPLLPLIPFENELNIILGMIDKWHKSKLLPETQFGIDLNDVDSFNTLYNGLASAGAMAISPAQNLIQYTIYISKTMFTFTKKDNIKMYIANEVYNESYSTFMAMFDVNRIKNKKSSNHKYYILGYKIT